MGSRGWSTRQGCGDRGGGGSGELSLRDSDRESMLILFIVSLSFNICRGLAPRYPCRSFSGGEVSLLGREFCALSRYTCNFGVLRGLGDSGGLISKVQ